jgi:glutaredoxin
MKAFSYMNQQKILILGLVFMSVAIVSCSQTPEVRSTTPELETFASCLTEKGATMYGTQWCGYCKNQKNTFGDAFSQINYIDCDLHKKECRDAGVKGYPTWSINGELHSGSKTIRELGALTGCMMTA